MKKILYSIETSQYRDTEKRNPMNNITTPRFSLNSLNHPRPRFLSYSVMPILFSLLAGLFILTACEEETAAPKKDSPPTITPIGDQTVSAGSSLTVSISATDPDPDQTPTLSYSPELPYASLTSTGNGTADLLFEPGRNVSPGTTTITITASSDDLTDMEQFTLTVTDPEDRPPTITTIEDQTVHAGSSLTVRISATDPDGQTPTLSYSPILPYATLTTNDNGTADLLFEPGRNVPPVTNNITITASSDTLTDTEVFILTITPPDNPPSITSISPDSVSVAIGKITNVTVIASDPDPDDTPSFSLLNNNLDFINLVDLRNGTATINITPLDPKTSTHVGQHMITVKASSGDLSAETNFTLNITDDDSDGDGTVDSLDVDDDNDSLIEINSLDDLHNIRHNLAGTSYKTNALDPGSMNGAPASSLNGYELARDLDFNDPTSYANGVVNTAWTMGEGWLPIGDNSTFNDSTRFSGILEGNGYKITNLMIRRDIVYIGLFGYIGRSGQVRNLGIENAVADYTENSDFDNYIGLLAGQSRGSIIAVHTSGIANGGDGDDDFVGGLVGWNSGGTITACYATGNANGGDGDTDRTGGLVGISTGTITACYSTGMADGGDGNKDPVGGLVGQNEGAITACYSTGMADGGAGNNDLVGGLVGWNNGGTITACYATGMADGGDGNNDDVGGLVGFNFNGTITACYATGMAGGDGNDEVGGLVGRNSEGTITACYGFGTVTRGGGVNRSGDASDSTTVDSASALTMANSSRNEANQWSARVWDFGDSSQNPVLKWITGYDGSGATDEAKYPCDPALLPAGRECGEIIPGQPR